MTSTTPHTQADVNDRSLAGAQAWFAHNGLTRPRVGRILGGVIAGFARRYQVNPLIALIVGITAVIVVSPLAYLALWILMPGEPALETAPIPSG
jgi:phage shock protein C